MSLPFAKCHYDKRRLKKLRNSPIEFANGRRVSEGYFGRCGLSVTAFKTQRGRWSPGQGGDVGKDRSGRRRRGAKEAAVLMSLKFQYSNKRRQNKKYKGLIQP